MRTCAGSSLMCLFIDERERNGDSLLGLDVPIPRSPRRRIAVTQPVSHGSRPRLRAVLPVLPQPAQGPVVVLAGGTGGAKLARGMLDVVAPTDLTVIANSGDDVEIYGAYVAPDADLITFWLADRIDTRGWGLDGDSFAVMDGLRDLGVDVWFNLGDRDLAIGLQRAHALAAGRRLTEAHAAIVGA